MRGAALVVGLLASGGSALAQPPQLSGPLTEALKAIPAGETLSAEHARALNTAALADGKLDPAEKAFLENIAVGTAFTASVNGESLPVKPGPDAQRIATLLARPADLNPMWSDPARFGELVEISRWAPVSKDRATRFVANRMLEAAGQSDVFNGYAPFRTLLEQKWATIKALPDAAAREAGRVLLYEASFLVRNHVVQSGRSLPDVTFAWLNDEQFKASLH